MVGSRAYRDWRRPTEVVERVEEPDGVVGCHDVLEQEEVDETSEVAEEIEEGSIAIETV